MLPKKGSSLCFKAGQILVWILLLVLVLIIIFVHSTDLSPLCLSFTPLQCYGIFKADIVTGLINSFVCFLYIRLEKLNKDFLFQTACQFSCQ